MARNRIIAHITLAIALVFSTNQVSSAEDFETPIVFSAKDVLPAEMMESESYRIDDEVRNDGFMNMYTVESEFGSWEISSTALLGIRLGEIVAMEKMREIDDDTSTNDAVKEDVDEVKEGFSNLIDDPGGTLKGAASGVGKMFKLTGEAWKSRHTRDENQLTALGKTVSGYDKAKRQYAGQFGVDPYSSNAALHEELDRLARAATKGSVIGIAVKVLIPGGLGMVISATNLSRALNELLVTKTEVELRIINREKLLAMGVDAGLTERFLDDGRSSASYKTYLVGALESMNDVKGREHYVAYAIAPPSEDVALYRTSSALMYAWYHKNVEKMDRFARVGALSVGVNKLNQLVIQAPLDHLLWTEPLGTIIASIDEAVSASETIKGKQVWLTGTVSDRSKSELENRGWKVQPKVAFDRSN